LLADAAFVDPTVAGAQELWNEPLHLMFPGLQQGDPTVLVDAASTLGEATSAECVRPESYIVLDVDTSYEWTVSEGQLSLSGAPYYSFWCQYPERGMAHHFHTLSVADVKNGAPYSYETVIQVGRASAFLRWYRAESLRSKGPGVLKWFWDSSENWEDLVAITREVSIEGHETPGFWSGHNPLLMFLMEALRQAQEGEDASE
jgi:hypothetical protein